MGLIKFEASGCAPCAAVDELLNKNGISYEKISIDNNAKEFSKYKVRSVPTLINLNDLGEEVNRVVGFKPEEILKIAQ